MNHDLRTPFAILGLGLAVGLAAGCGPTDVWGDSELGAELAIPTSFALENQDSHLVATAVALRDDRDNTIDFTITEGRIEVQSAAGGRLGLSDLDVTLEDVTIPDSILPPDGLVLTDLHVTLDAGASGVAEWTADDRRVEVALDVDLALAWSMLRDGASHPLADVHVSAVPVYLIVERDGGGLRASLAADRRGRFWSWADTFELRDLSAELSAE